MKNKTAEILASGAHNVDFGLKDDNGKTLLVGDKVHLKSKIDKWERTVTLEYKDGIFGFQDDETKSLIPIAWHVNYSFVIKQ